MIVYTKNISPRLQYIADFIGKQISGESLQLTTDSFYFSDHSGLKINYSDKRISENELLVINHSLLFEDSVSPQRISCFEVNNYKAFFRTEGDYPFDIFAACFYLLSRYEEYLPYKKDSYGRYAHENSLAFKENFLHVPLINIWLEDFKSALKTRFPSFSPQINDFSFQPTYDVDEAFAFKNKEFARTLGGLARSVLNGEWSMVKERIYVLGGKKEDPYEAYTWMDKLHETSGLKPHYFFHVATEKGKYDKNISPFHPEMRLLIQRHAERYPIGIHPSWKSGDEEEQLGKEIRVLETIVGKKVTTSRQHYIRFTLPQTFRRLIAAGITHDYSMGYGSINGFRASVASPFYWYDLKKEQQTDLLLHPFCFMEANSFFEQKYLPQRAYEEMMHYYHAVKAVNGKLITIWHNNFLGSYPLFQGWKEVYGEFVRNVSRQA